jgi:AcrR family transcriptional regulator
MPTATFLGLPEERRMRLVEEAITEFAERSYAEASLSQIVRRAGIAKGSLYQYFEDKLDLYRWLLTEEVPRRKRAFVAASAHEERDFWAALERLIERGMAFLVEHPKLARITAAATHPAADEQVRGLHRAVCEAGTAELQALLERGVRAGAISRELDITVVTRFVSAIIGPGLTEVVLRELGAELHEVLASEALRRRLGPTRRTRLARQAIQMIRGGLEKKG